MKVVCVVSVECLLCMFCVCIVLVNCVVCIDCFVFELCL